MRNLRVTHRRRRSPHGRVYPAGHNSRRRSRCSMRQGTLVRRSTMLLWRQAISNVASRRIASILASIAFALSPLSPIGTASVTFAAGYASAVLADHPAAYWRMDETSGSVAKDSSGNGHSANLFGVSGGASGALAADP